MAKGSPIVERDPSKGYDYDKSPWDQGAGRGFMQALTNRPHARGGGGGGKGGKGGGGGGAEDQMALMTHSGNMNVWEHGQKARIDVDKARLNRRDEANVQMAGHVASKLTISDPVEAVHVAALHQHLLNGDYTQAHDLAHAMYQRSNPKAQEGMKGVHSGQMADEIQAHPDHPDNAPEMPEGTSSAAEAAQHSGFTPVNKGGQSPQEAADIERIRKENIAKLNPESGEAPADEEHHTGVYTPEEEEEAAKVPLRERAGARVQQVKEGAANLKANVQEKAAAAKEKGQAANMARAEAMDKAEAGIRQAGRKRASFSAVGEDTGQISLAERPAHEAAALANADTQVLRVSALRRKRDEKAGIKPVHETPFAEQPTVKMPAVQGPAPTPENVGTESSTPSRNAEFHGEAAKHTTGGGVHVTPGDVGTVAASVVKNVAKSVAVNAAADAAIGSVAGPEGTAGGAAVGVGAGVIKGTAKGVAEGVAKVAAKKAVQAGAEKVAASRTPKLRLQPTAEGHVNIHIDKAAHPDWEGYKDRVRAHVAANPGAKVNVKWTPHLRSGGPIGPGNAGGMQQFTDADKAFDFIEGANKHAEEMDKNG